MKRPFSSKYANSFPDFSARIFKSGFNSPLLKTRVMVLFFLFAFTAKGQETITVTGTKFTYPLIEKWIAEYSKINSGVKIRLVQKPTGSQTADLTIIAHQPANEELNGDHDIIYTARYALLPATNLNNSILANAPKKGLNKKEIDKLFFEVINYDDEAKIEKSKFSATIYSRENQACSSVALAGYFGHMSSEIRGKKVLGDDIYLLTAIKKDSIGLTYNNLGYLFDLNSRKLKDGLALLPLDLKKDLRDLLTGDLDQVIADLERNRIETVPVEKIGFIYSQKDERREISDFLRWVLAEGQKFNHQEGFLNLDKEVLAEQTSRLREKFLTLK